MAKRDWALIEQLTAALGQSNTPKSVPRAVGLALQGDWDAREVELVLSMGGRVTSYEAVRSNERWVSRHREGTRSPRSKTALTQGKRTRTLSLGFRLGADDASIHVRFGVSGVPIQDDPAYLRVLARVVEVGLGHQLLILRVADLSRHAHAENRELRQTLIAESDLGLVARSAEMQAVVDRIAMVARYDTAVLIRGESGVGKELAARMIHRRSPRFRRPFVQVNCGAIPSQLVESELFGHEKGAFTGAERTHRGVFEQADGGVLLLDEVGDLPLDAQVKLLRVLQERSVRRVGAETETRVDVRLVAATNRPLEDMVRIGTFREDLFYRLNVFPIDIPPLRDRIDDLPALVHTLLDRLASRLGTSRPAVPNAILVKLSSHHWPGNVRELANVLEAALILGGGRTLELAPNFDNGLPATSSKSEAVRTFESAVRATIENALRATGGRVYGDNGAAAALDLHPATLQSKMRKLGIRRAAFVPRR